MVGLWERHHGLMASLRKAPLTRGEHHSAYRSGARNDDEVLCDARAFERRLALCGHEVPRVCAQKKTNAA